MRFITCLIFLASMMSFLPKVHAADELVIYSSKNASYVKPLFDEYSRENGVAISFLVGPTPALISRLEIEGKGNKADIILGSGASYFWTGSEKGLFAIVPSRTLERNVPEHLKSPKNDWFSFSKRARTIIYNTEKVSESDLIGYADLADKKWQGRLCLRTSSADYSLSLIAMLIESHGVENMQATVDGWVNNLAVPPMQDDMQIVEAITEGSCDIGIINSYYYARLKREQPETNLKLFWADQNGSGVHMNVTAAAVTANSSNKLQAIDFLEWLTTKQPQVRYANLSMEYPVNPKVYPAREVAKWGHFEEDTHLVAKAGENRKLALELIQNAHYK
ncbi:MAG: extracellular solute-binding protein [Neptuniibacter sp.]